MSSDIALTVTSSSFDTPRAVTGRGGFFYLSATSGTSAITINSVSITNANAG